MAKIGTAHVEIKPVLNEEALREICETVERSIGDAIRAGMTVPGHMVLEVTNYGDLPDKRYECGLCHEVQIGTPPTGRCPGRQP